MAVADGGFLWKADVKITSNMFILFSKNKNIMDEREEGRCQMAEILKKYNLFEQWC